MLAVLSTLAVALFLISSTSAATLTTPYANTSTVGPYNNMTMTSPTPLASPTVTTTTESLTPTVVFSTEIATGPGGVGTSTFIVAVTAPGGAAATKAATTAGAGAGAGSTTGPTPGLQTAAAGRNGVEAAMGGMVGLAGWMIVLGMNVHGGVLIWE